MRVYTDISQFKNVATPVLTIGTFDGVHKGHQKLIERIKRHARETGGESVLLTFYPHPRMVLFPHDETLRLLSTQREKIELLQRFGLDHLIIHPFSKAFSRLSATEYVRDVLVNGIGMKKLVIGYDHQFGRNREGGLDQLCEFAPLYDFDVEEIPAQEIDEVAVSSTKIRRALLEGDVSTSNNYLGYHYTLSGIVTHGRKIGREIGFPTANIQIPDKTKLIPAEGVYAVNVVLPKGEKKGGMLYIGRLPEFNASDNPTIEVNIFEFNEDIYNQTITIELLAFVREYIKFDSPQELKTQLEKDKSISIQLIIENFE
ncbi:MAG: bifunctional riboflavin kinase/FAD synthetase [Flavobacteriales bacterium]